MAIGIFGILDSPKKDWLIIILICSLMFLVSTYLIIYSLIFKIIIKEGYIEQKTIFGRVKQIKWNEIENVRFGLISLELKIQSSKEKIKAHFHMIGFQELVTLLEENTDFNSNRIGLPKINNK